MLKLETSKACQDTDIPTKIMKENADIFADILLGLTLTEMVLQSII